MTDTDRARELVDNMLDKRGIRLMVGASPCATFDQHFRQDFAALIASALAEERERAIEYNNPPFESDEWWALHNAYSAGWCDGYKAKHVEFDWIDEGFEEYLEKVALHALRDGWRMSRQFSEADVLPKEKT